MKNQLTITLNFLLFLAVSCSYNKPAPGSNEIFVDFKSESPMVVNGPEDIFNYSDYIDSVVYVPLETSDECLIGEISDMHFVNDRIFVKSGFSIFIFGKDGKFISKISRRGRGHGEYSNMAGWDVNPSNNEISIYSNADETIYVYSIQANFLRSVRLEGIHRDFCVLPNGNYLFYTPDYMKNHYRGVLQTDPEGNIINQPLVLSGSARKCIHFSKNFVHLSNGQVGVIGPFGFDNIYHISTDTSEIAYHITTNVKIAQSVLEDDTPGSFMEQELYCLESYLETDNIVSFEMSNMKEKGVDVKYDKQTGKTFCRSWKWENNQQPQLLGTHFLPGDKMLLDDSGRWADYGVILSEISASFLMQMPEEMRNQIAPDCTMDSNPVVCLYYYKR